MQPTPRSDSPASALMMRPTRDALGRDLVREMQRSARRRVVEALPEFHPLCELVPKAELALGQLADAPGDAPCAARPIGMPLAAAGWQSVVR